MNGANTPNGPRERQTPAPAGPQRAWSRRLLVSAILCTGSLVLTWLAQRFGYEEVLLPYQLPVLLAGYYLPMTWAVGCAVTMPVLGSIVLAFPDPIVMLPLVACQMIALAAFANFLYTMLEMNPFGVYVLSVAFSYVILFCAAAIYGAVSNGAVQPLVYVRYTLVYTWPSLVAELLAPVVVAAHRRGKQVFRKDR